MISIDSGFTTHCAEKDGPKMLCLVRLSDRACNGCTFDGIIGYLRSLL